MSTRQPAVLVCRGDKAYDPVRCQTAPGDAGFHVLACPADADVVLRAFNEDGDRGADESFRERLLLLFAKLDETSNSSFLLTLRYVVGHGSGFCSGSLAVREDMQVGEGQILHQEHRILKRPRVLSRQSDNQVCSKAKQRYSARGVVDKLAVVLHRVATAHVSKQSVIAALKGKVEIAAQFLRVGHAIDHGPFRG